MAAKIFDSTGRAGAADLTGDRRWWVSRFSRNQERRLYFLATVAAAAWYLATRVL